MIAGNERALRLNAATVIQDCVEGSRRGGVITGGMIEGHRGVLCDWPRILLT